MAETITTTTGTSSYITPIKAEAPEIDYDKIASILDGKMKVTEDKVLAGYFKSKDLTPEEASQAIETFKKTRAEKQPNLEQLNAKLTEKDTEIATANKRALMAETKVEAMTMAGELGVEQKVIPYLLKMADLSTVIEDGKISQEKLKESLVAVISDIPQLKVSPEDKGNGFKIGADTSKNTNTSQDELARIFGVKK